MPEAPKRNNVDWELALGFKNSWQRFKTDAIREAMTTFDRCKRSTPPEPLPAKMNDHKLDDRFHETGIDETGSMELEGYWWIPRLRLAERGAVSWQDGVKRSGGRGGMRGTRG